MNVFMENYKAYIGNCKTEWEAAAYAEKELVTSGFREINAVLDAGESLLPGDKVYEVNRDRGICAAVVGEKDAFQIVSAHLDSPVLFLRPNPALNRCGLALASMFSKGGLRRHTVVDIPLALHGKLVLQDGSVKELVMGEDAEDPVLLVPEITAHVSASQSAKTLKEAYTDDQMVLAMGTLAQDEDCKHYLDDLLQRQLGVRYSDLKYGDIYVVPALMPRDVGLDRSMIAAYGHDDRCCVYCALQAILEAKPSGNTAVAMLVDREELGSYGNTGAASEFYRSFLMKIRKARTGDGSTLGLVNALSASRAVNGDVTFAAEPMDGAIMEQDNNAVLGRGAAIATYGGNGLPQYRGSVQRALDARNIPWQVSTAIKGAGPSFLSSVSQSFNRQNMDTISIGPALSGMHTAYELVSKADLYATYQSYLCFMEATTLL